MTMTAGFLNMKKKKSAIRNDLFSMEEKDSGDYQTVTNMNNNEFCASIF